MHRVPVNSLHSTFGPVGFLLFGLLVTHRLIKIQNELYNSFIHLAFAGVCARLGWVHLGHTFTVGVPG